MTLAGWLAALAGWWSSGAVFMPVMLGVALVLYAVIGERLWTLLICAIPTTAVAEELTAGFALIRALTVALPLLGLLGTVTGMVTTFASLAQPQRAVASGASAGIAEALAATQYGILLAVPAMVLLWALRHRTEAVLRALARQDRAP